jgi:hypothetical protein
MGELYSEREFIKHFRKIKRKSTLGCFRKPLRRFLFHPIPARRKNNTMKEHAEESKI